MSVSTIEERCGLESTSAPGPEKDWVPLFALVLLLALSCAWILSLPVFPSQDGPIHVYFAAVTRSLLAGDSAFAAGFRVAHILPPYCLHSYLLILLMQSMPGAAAEKVVACICIISLALGFLYFARQVGPRGALIAVFAVPFFLHRYLFIGLYGYSIGLGMALLGMGIWCRDDRFRRRRRLAFLLVALAASFTHPVPYLLLLAYCASDVLVGFVLWRFPRAQGGRLPQFARPRRSDLLTLLLAGSALAYVSLYAHSGALWTVYSRWELLANLRRLADLLQMLTVAPLKSIGYLAVLRAVFLLLLGLAGWQAWKDLRRGRFTRAHLALGWGLLVVISLPFLPDQMNGSFLFADRPAIWCVLLLMAAAAGVDLDPGAAKLALAVACASGLIALTALGLYVTPIARQTDVSLRTPLATGGAHVLLANNYRPLYELTWDPYVLAGVRIVEQEKGILVASPFMDLQIIMLQPTGPQSELDKLAAEPGRLLPKLRPGDMIVVTRCDQSPPNGNTPPWLRDAYAGWKLSRYSCFDILQPGS